MMKLLRALPLALVLLAGCGGTTVTVKEATTSTARVAGQLHQPGAPVVEAPVRPATVPPSAGTEARADGLVRAAGASCGRERWAVKTATDEAAGSIVLAPKKATVAELGALPTENNGNLDQGREPSEKQVYEVTAELVEAKRESDSDFHLVLNDGGHTMIGEIPDAPACTEPPVTERVSALEEQIEHARAAFVQEFGEAPSYPSHGLEIHHQVTLTGVLFFDVPHGQTGVAPNAVELHPVLTIADP